MVKHKVIVYSNNQEQVMKQEKTKPIIIAECRHFDFRVTRLDFDLGRIQIVEFKAVAKNGTKCKF
jgi:hypothetical protein